jgi:hypothetical protein
MASDEPGAAQEKRDWRRKIDKNQGTFSELVPFKEEYVNRT